MAFVKMHLPCEECGSSDALSLNDDGSAWCFSCQHYFKDYNKEPVADFKVHKNNTMNTSPGVFVELTDRDISLETAKKYGVKAQQNQNGEIITHRYPYYIENEISGHKVRDVGNKEFRWEGSSTGTGLFGQQLFQKGGKYITLTEGECDAMAAYELLGARWPVVSIKSGAMGGVKDVKENLEFLESFDTVVISFDSDKVGRDGAKQIARILRPGKAKLLMLPEGFKDPNDMLKQKRKEAYVSAWWDAQLYTPSGVLNVAQMQEEWHDREVKESIPYPWAGLNLKLYGLRQGELLTLTGGTGLGKSSVTRELEHWLINKTEDNIGVLALEENWHRTVDGILSIEANARLYIDQIRDMYAKEELDNLYEKVIRKDGKERVWIHSHLGVTDIDEVFSKLRFMIIGCNCKWIILDHLHMMVSSLVEGDERRTIDNIMTRLRSLVEETGCGLILVSHLRKLYGTRGHEEGSTVGLGDLRGSQSIAQLSDCVIAIERNQQSEDPIEANTTHVKVLKSRYTGDVGVATHLVYNQDTGRLSEIDMDITADDEIEEIPW